ncbi:DUF4328 domain-containing protein [Demequina soli]|uniref:DUF4328 domain-containing protein n=1 Tax=Demequina soli TaxID=1638987 RepID=UPI000780D5E5|nr:DUF4328 domain-containing protein [Demequina soli]
MADNDPFLQQPGEPQQPEPPRYHPASGLNPGQTPGPPPASSAPGLIPGATPPAPTYDVTHQVPLDRNGVPLEAPRALGNALVWIAAAYTLVMILLAVFAQGEVDATRRAADTGEIAFGAGTFISLLSTPLMIASFVVYGMWMSRMRRNREALGTRPGLTAVEWWGWLVPIGSLVLVPMGARRVAGRTTSLGVLLGWWIVWTLAQGVGNAASFALTFSMDLTTGAINNGDLLDAYPSLMWASAAITLIAWVLFRSFIRQATERHLQPDA